MAVVEDLHPAYSYSRNLRALSNSSLVESGEMKIKSFLATLLWMALFAQCLPSRAQVVVESPQPEPNYSSDTWHVGVTPYIWFSGLDGALNLRGHEAAVHQSFGDIFSNLKIGVMGMGEVRRGRVGLLADLLFVRVGDQNALPVPQLPDPVQVKLTSTTFTMTPLLAYRVYSKKHIALDGLGGLRVYHLGANIKFDAGSAGQYGYGNAGDWVDVTAGARVLAKVTPKIGAFLIGDAGGGGSSPSWEIAWGAGYKVMKNATLQLGYKRLYFDRQAGPNFNAAVSQQGLMLGTTIVFR
jgi:hypothetical protein